jgi:hypothetical protein
MTNLIKKSPPTVVDRLVDVRVRPEVRARIIRIKGRIKSRIIRSRIKSLPRLRREEGGLGHRGDGPLRPGILKTKKRIG